MTREKSGDSAAVQGVKTICGPVENFKTADAEPDGRLVRGAPEGG
jgi:hypothetical protein